MLLDLRKYGQKFILVSNEWGIDLRNCKDLKVVIGSPVGGGNIKFDSLQEMNEFLGQWTQTTKTISQEELESKIEIVK